MISTIIRTALPRASPLSFATFSTTTRAMVEGATGSGAGRAGGAAQGDAFTKREKANEDFYVKEKEKEKLMALKKKLEAQRAHLDELDQHIKELSKSQGGEQN